MDESHLKIVTCELCGNGVTTDGERAMRACLACSRKLGIIPMPPSRRKPRPCASCNGMQFVRVIPREYTSYQSGDSNGQVAAPMYVTAVPSVGTGWLVGKHVQDLELPQAGVGILEMHICRTCGAATWSCVDVERIPIHPHLMTELVDLAGDTAYRE